MRLSLWVIWLLEKIIPKDLPLEIIATPIF